VRKERQKLFGWKVENPFLMADFVAVEVIFYSPELYLFFSYAACT